VQYSIQTYLRRRLSGIFWSWICVLHFWLSTPTYINQKLYCRPYCIFEKYSPTSPKCMLMFWT